MGGGTLMGRQKHILHHTRCCYTNRPYDITPPVLPGEKGLFVLPLNVARWARA